ncbi:DoxX family protein [Halostella sp. PRR32]|uniref:DoxX family protein n=1 Tax=Halostella sp. PRR32 TaxID=3098147 RepID=UPI002B1CF17F|nr:DoxX family protein [Halostella sp. PRR32]
MSPNSDSPATWLRRHGRPGLRIGTAVLLLGPGVRKYLTYAQSVYFFTSLGLPMPELSVVLVGAIEVGAALSLFLNRVPWLGALLAVPVMAVAIVTAGPSWQNVSVLLAGTFLFGSDRRVLGAIMRLFQS